MDRQLSYGSAANTLSATCFVLDEGARISRFGKRVKAGFFGPRGFFVAANHADFRSTQIVRDAAPARGASDDRATIYRRRRQRAFHRS
ncbi:MAG TPA: hypothetical protein DD670_14890 [Planctomycetaceae bacterium]|nr:hypothetical protein [Planctomycetaceae bacterium]